MATSTMLVYPGFPPYRNRHVGSVAVLLLVLLLLPLAAEAQQSTTTALTVAPNPATAGQVVTLTAMVTSGSAPVTVGTVSFLSGKQVLGTVQVVKATGTATLKTRFAPGTFQLNAQYNANNLFQTSQSGPQALTVNGPEPTFTTLTDQADGNNWDFTVSVLGLLSHDLTGTASFTDLTTMISLGSVPLGSGMSGFQPQQAYGTGNNPNGVAIGDFNGDGCPDLAVTNETAGSVSVLLGIVDHKTNNCTGTFQAQTTYTVTGTPQGIAVADFNGDGCPDLAIANENGAAVNVLLGDCTGMFQQQDYHPGSNPVGIAVGDFNSDGFADLALTNDDGTVSVLLGDGTGNFSQPQGSPYTVGGSLGGIAVADFNGDGCPDLAVTTTGMGNPNVSVLLATNQSPNCDGTFQLQQQTYTVGNKPMGIAVGHFNGDGNADLAVTNNGDGTVSVLLGNGNGTFQMQSELGTADKPTGITVADFNGDGIADLAVTCRSNPPVVDVFLGKGDGSFPNFQNYPVGSSPDGIAAADLNGDGVPDVVTANSAGNTASILLGGSVTSGQLKNVPVNGNNGVHMIQSTYTPMSGFYEDSLSNIVMVNGNGSLIPTTTTISSSQNPSQLNQPVTFTALVTSNAGGGPPTGTVNFTNNGSPLCTAVPLDSGGQAQCTTSALTGGTHAILATYSGDQNFATSQGGLNQLVQASTTTSLSVAPNPATAGQVVTLTATVTSAGNPVNDGTVTFLSGKQVLATVQVAKATGTATLKTRFAPGTLQLNAQYNANKLFQTSQSGPQQLTVNGTEPTMTTVQATPDGNNYDFTVSVFGYGLAVPDPPTGTASLTEVSTGLNLGNIGLSGPGMSFFLPQQTYPAGLGYEIVAAADLNGDGILDLAVTNWSQNTISVLLGKGDGTFQPQQTYHVGQEPTGIVAADFNGDGILDLAVVNQLDGNVSVLLGKGDGTFQPQQTYTVGNQPWLVAVADFDGDGILDLAVTNFGDDTVSVLLGKGDGTFQPQQTYGVAGGPIGVAAADFNGDGVTDLAVTNEGRNNVSVLLGKGDGTFQPQQTYPVGDRPVGVATADFNGDGILDLAVANVGSDNVGVLLGNGDGTFQPQTTSMVGTGPFGIAVGDFNGDGILDLAVANEVDANVSVLLGKGDGTFQPQTTYKAGNDPHWVATGDFNGDGTPDLAVGNCGANCPVGAAGTVSVLLGGAMTAGQLLNVPVPGKGPQQVQTTYTPNTNFYSGSQAVTEVQGSGGGTATTTTLTVSPMMATPGQPLTLTATVVGNNEPVTIGTVTFLSGKQVLGTVQMVKSGQSAGTATLKQGFGPGVYSLTADYNANDDFLGSQSAAQQLSVNGTEPTMTTVQATPDGNNYDFTVSVFGYGLPPPTGTASLTEVSNGMNLGSIGLVAPGINTFLPQEVFQVGNLPRGGIASGDFNGDGCPDLAVGNQNDNTVTILLGVFDPVHQICTGGLKQVHAPFPVDRVPEWIAVGDFNADGVLDLAVACHDSNAIDVLFGNGDGTFQAKVAYPTDTAIAVAVGDFNNDGFPDLASAGISSGQAGALINNGDGTFTQLQTFPAGMQPTGIAVGEFNSDGNLDMAVSASTSNQVAVLLGNGDGTFQQPTQFYNVGNNPQGIATGDFNGDGCLDLAVTNYNDNTVGVLLGQVSGGSCDGTFLPQVTYPTGKNPQGITVADFNGDGFLDLAVTNASGNTVGVLLGKGDGSFQPQVTYSVGSNPIDIAVADFLGDGVSDIAVTNVRANTVSVLLGGTATMGQLKNVFVGPPGQQQINATYTPNTNFYAGSQGSVQVQGQLIPTATTVSSSANPSSYLQPVTFTATVMGMQGGSPTGTVEFLADGADIPGCAAVNLTAMEGGSVATCMLATLQPGGHRIVANYSGDPNFAPSSGQLTPNQVVNAAGTTTVVTGNPPSPSKLGQPVTFTATVTGAFGGSPAGTVNFTDNGAPIAGCTGVALMPQQNGSSALCTTAALGGGQNSVAGIYTGDPEGLFTASTGMIPYYVQVATATTLSLSPPSPVGAGQPVTLTATVLSNGSPVTVGTVTFLSGKQVLGTVQVAKGSGTATLKMGFAPAVYSLTAEYNANNDFQASQSAPQQLTVNGTEPSITTLTDQPDGNNFDFTSTIFGLGFATPTGQVKFNDLTNGFLMGTVKLSGSGTWTFLPQQQYQVGNEPLGAAVGDFNGDGFPDLVVANNPDNTISVLLGNGDGTFQQQKVIQVGSGPTFLAVADFNGDGIPDVAVTNFNDATVGVLLGKGDGTFQPQLTFPVGAGPVGIATGDFNGDGIADLAVANLNDNTVSVLLGNGDGTFQPQQKFKVGQSPYGLAIADFNGDRLADIAVVNFTDSTVSVLLGKGDGTFQPQQTYPVGQNPYWVAAGYLNQDGIPDLAVANGTAGTVSVLLGNGDGSFQRQQEYSVGNGPTSVVIADFNGDGIADLATANSETNTVSVLLGSGKGAFQPQQTYRTGLSPYAVVAADFNGDAVPDLAAPIAGDASVSVLLGGTAITAQLLNIPVIGNGDHTIQSDYAPDASSIYAASPSNTLTLPAGGAATPTVFLQASPREINYGNSLLLVAVPQSPGGGTPTGTVTFVDGTTPLSTVNLDANGVANYTNTTLVQGQHSITATYNGDSNFNSATSDAVMVTVDAPFILQSTQYSATVSPGGQAQFQTNVIAAYKSSPLVYASMTCNAPAGTGITCAITCPHNTPAACVLLSTTEVAAVTINTPGGSAHLAPPLQRGEHRGIAILAGFGGIGLLGLVFLPVGLSRKAAGGVLFLVMLVLCFGTSCGTSFAPGSTSPPANNTFYVSVNAELREQLGDDPTQFRTLGLQKFWFTLLIK